MKKLISVFCCVLCMNNITKPPSDLGSTSKTSGEKVLIKALAAIVNREENKKTTFKKVHIPSSGLLWIYG